MHVKIVKHNCKPYHQVLHSRVVTRGSEAEIRFPLRNFCRVPSRIRTTTLRVVIGSDPKRSTDWATQTSCQYLKIRASRYLLWVGFSACQLLQAESQCNRTCPHSYFVHWKQRHGIGGDARIEKIDTQPLKIVSDLAAPWLNSRAGTARLLHCINSVRSGKVPLTASIRTTPPKGRWDYSDWKRRETWIAFVKW